MEAGGLQQGWLSKIVYCRICSIPPAYSDDFRLAPIIHMQAHSGILARGMAGVAKV